MVETLMQRQFCVFVPFLVLDNLLVNETVFTFTSALCCSQTKIGQMKTSVKMILFENLFIIFFDSTYKELVIADFFFSISASIFLPTPNKTVSLFPPQRHCSVCLFVCLFVSLFVYFFALSIFFQLTLLLSCENTFGMW